MKTEKISPIKNQMDKKFEKLKFFIWLDWISDLIFKTDVVQFNPNQTCKYVYIFIHNLIISLMFIFLLLIYL